MRYHAHFLTRRNRRVLAGNEQPIAELVRARLQRIKCDCTRIVVTDSSVELDVTADPRISPHRVVKYTKKTISSLLDDVLPGGVKRGIGMPSLWTSDYVCSSTPIELEEIQKLITRNPKN